MVVAYRHQRRMLLQSEAFVCERQSTSGCDELLFLGSSGECRLDVLRTERVAGDQVIFWVRELD